MSVVFPEFLRPIKTMKQPSKPLGDIELGLNFFNLSFILPKKILFILAAELYTF